MTETGEKIPGFLFYPFGTIFATKIITLCYSGTFFL